MTSVPKNILPPPIFAVRICELISIIHGRATFVNPSAQVFQNCLCIKTAGLPYRPRRRRIPDGHTIGIVFSKLPFASRRRACHTARFCMKRAMKNAMSFMAFCFIEFCLQRGSAEAFVRFFGKEDKRLDVCRRCLFDTHLRPRIPTSDTILFGRRSSCADF